MIASQPTLRDQVALSLLAFLGLRKDELRRLQVRDVDLEARAFVVHGKGGHVDTLPLAFEHLYDAPSSLPARAQPQPGGIPSFAARPPGASDGSGQRPQLVQALPARCGDGAELGTAQHAAT